MRSKFINRSNSFKFVISSASLCRIPSNPLSLSVINEITGLPRKAASSAMLEVFANNYTSHPLIYFLGSEFFDCSSTFCKGSAHFLIRLSIKRLRPGGAPKNEH